MPRQPFELLGKKAIAKTAQQSKQGEGKVISYCDAPTVTIQMIDGSQMNWRADLCEFSEWTDKDEIELLRAEIDRLTKELHRLSSV